MADLYQQHLALIDKVRVFHHLREMGMFEGKYGKAEACRRNAAIVELRNSLGLTRKQLTFLVNQAQLQNHPLQAPSRNEKGGQ
jgi:hypothetical protein